MKTTESSETCDAILGGAVCVIQPREGYRFSVDSLLLARFVKIPRIDRVLELGAASGVIALAIEPLYKQREIVAVEIQPQLVERIGRNAALNHLDSIHAVAADLREMPADGFDVVVANPPYRATGSGRESPH